MLDRRCLDVEIAMLHAAGDAARIDIHHDGDTVVHRDRERLGAAHATEPAGEGDRSREGAVEPFRSHGGKRFIGALQDPLGADVDPRTGGHLAIHRETQLLEAAEFIPICPIPDQVGVGQKHARSPFMRAHHANRFARLHEHRFVVLQRDEGAHDRVVAVPVAHGLARAAVDDELVRVLCDLRVEVVLQHPQRGLLRPAEGVQRVSAKGANGPRPGCDTAHRSFPPASETTDAAAASSDPSNTMACAAAMSGAR